MLNAMSITTAIRPQFLYSPIVNDVIPQFLSSMLCCNAIHFTCYAQYYAPEKVLPHFVASYQVGMVTISFVLNPPMMVGNDYID